MKKNSSMSGLNSNGEISTAWALVNELSARLNSNHQASIRLNKNIDSLDTLNQNYNQYSSIDESSSQHEVDNISSTSPKEYDDYNDNNNNNNREDDLSMARLNRENQILKNQVQLLQQQTNEFPSVVANYEAALSQIMEELRDQMYKQKNIMTSIHAGYCEKLAQKEQEYATLRQEYTKLLQGLGNIAEWLREANGALNDDGLTVDDSHGFVAGSTDLSTHRHPLGTILTALQAENINLRRAILRPPPSPAASITTQDEHPGPLAPTQQLQKSATTAASSDTATPEFMRNASYS